MKLRRFLVLGWMFNLLLTNIPDGVAAPSPGGDFSLKLYKGISSSKSEENLIISPYAIRMGLGMAAFGARGHTQKQLLRTPDAWTPRRDSTKLLVANRLWVQKGVRISDTFMEASDNNFSVTPWFVDFTKAPDFLADRVNGWVAERTLGKVHSMIDENSTDKSMVMILSTGGALKGTWSTLFERVPGRDQFDTDTSAGTVKAKFLHKKGYYHYAETNNVQILEIPYSDGDLSMDIFLPKSASALKDFEKSLNAENLERWLNGLSSREVNITLPKFEFDSSVEMSSTLKALGVNEAFNSSSADFSAMAGKGNLYLSKVFHTSQISLTEEGTEIGMGAISNKMRTLASESNIPNFKADHPFMFLIRNKHTNLIFFAGHLVQP